MKWLSLLAACLLYSVVAAAADAPANFVLPDAPKPAPDIIIADSDGRTGALADFRGKFVLLNIWATWCIPCRKEMPTLDRLQGQLGGTEFEVVALSIDRGSAETVRKFFTDIGIQHLAIRFDAAAEAPFKLAAVGLPTTVLIDPKGQEIGRLIGPAEWDSAEMIDFLRTAIARKAGESSSTPKQEKPS